MVDAKAELKIHKNGYGQLTYEDHTKVIIDKRGMCSFYFPRKRYTIETTQTQIGSEKYLTYTFTPAEMEVLLTAILAVKKAFKQK